MNHAYHPLLARALAASQEAYNDYLFYWLYGGLPGFRRVGLKGRAMAAVTFDRVMAEGSK